GFVLKLTPEFKQATIGHRFTQAAVSQHSFDIQIFQADHLVLVDQSGRYLVQKISAAIGNSGMNSGDTVLLLPSSMRAFPLAGKPTLSHSQLPSIAVGVFGRAGLKAIRSYGNIFNTHIYPDSVPSHRQGENIDLTGHADKIAPTRVFAHRHPLGSALDKARPFKLKLAQ